MNRKTISITMLTMLLISMLGLAFNIQPAKTEPTTIIVPDDYLTIQEAINHANSGDTILVSAGTYRENVVVDKTVSLVGENRETTIVDGRGLGHGFNVRANDVTIEGFTITNGGAAINVMVWIGTKIINNRIVENYNGIQTYHATNNKVWGNVIADNENMGITLWTWPPENAGVVSYNSIYGNGRYGLVSVSFVDARNNWWGDLSGPYHPTSWTYDGEVITNPDGQGDRVSDNVLYEPWLLSPSLMHACIVDPGYYEHPNDYLLWRLSEYLSDAEYEVSVIKGTDVTIEWLKSGLKHEVVFLRGHGDAWSSGETIFWTYEDVTPETEELYLDDLQAGRVVKKGTTEENYWGITSKFVRHYYGSNGFRNSLIYSQTCDGLKYNTMAQAFIDCGAGAYMSYPGLSYPFFTDTVSEASFYYFCVKGYNVKQVYDVMWWSFIFTSRLSYAGDPTLKIVPTPPSTNQNLAASVMSPVSLYIIDPMGRHMGIDPSTGEVILEIPNAIYVSGEEGHQAIWIPDALDGDYELLLTGNGAGAYQLKIGLSDIFETNFQEFVGETVEGATYVYSISITDEEITAAPDSEAELEYLKDFVGGLPDTSFDKPWLSSQRMNALFNKIDEVILKVEVANYTDAINKLFYDIRAKMDDYSTPKDWMICQTTELCIIIDHIISSIETLQPQPD